MMDKEGKKVRCIEHTLHKMTYLRSIALGREDNIFYCDESGKRLGMSNRNCDKVSVKYTKQVKGPGYIDMAVVGEEVMVTEKGNEGLITVYDRNLECVRDISGKGKAPLRHLHPD